MFLACHLNGRAVPATAITARLFLGRQVQCTQCHNHPFNDWQQSQFWGMNAFFRGTRRAGRGQDGITLTDNPSKPMVDFEKRSGEINYTFRKFFDNTIDRNADAKPRPPAMYAAVSGPQRIGVYVDTSRSMATVEAELYEAIAALESSGHSISWPNIIEIGRAHV